MLVAPTASVWTTRPLVVHMEEPQEPKLIKNFESNAAYNKGDIIRGRFEDGQIRYAVAMDHIGEAVSQQDLLRLHDKQEIHNLTVDATSAKGDEYTVTLGIGADSHVITTKAVDDNEPDAVAKAIAVRSNAKRADRSRFRVRYYDHPYLKHQGELTATSQ